MGRLAGIMQVESLAYSLVLRIRSSFLAVIRERCVMMEEGQRGHWWFEDGGRRPGAREHVLPSQARR